MPPLWLQPLRASEGVRGRPAPPAPVLCTRGVRVPGSYIRKDRSPVEPRPDRARTAGEGAHIVGYFAPVAAGVKARGVRVSGRGYVVDELSP